MFLQPLLVLVPVLVVSVSHDASRPSVEVSEGAESVELPCQVPVSVSTGSTSVWDRDDFRIPTVHVRQPDGDYLKDQNQRFEGWTSMMEDALQTGDLTLTLRRPTFTDSGTFTCTVRRFGEDLHRENVELLVKEAPPPVWPWFLALVLVVLLVVAAVVWYCRSKKAKTEFLPEKVEIREGVKSVLLPFKTDRALSQDVRVKWTRSDLGNVRIHVFENGQMQFEQQDNRYEGRTKLKANLLETGDVSLSLKNPQLKDSGDYECVVSRGGKLLAKKTVTLKVKVHQVEKVTVEEGSRSIVLPFRIARHLLSEEITVEWRLSDTDDKVLYSYCGGVPTPPQDPPYKDHTEMNEDPVTTGDLSLTIKDFHLTDSVYICTIRDKEGRILQQKVVVLIVRALQAEIVAITKGETSVSLPCKMQPPLDEDTRVEWTHPDSKHKKVFTFANGGIQTSKQDNVYCRRTEMDKDLLRSGDLSLVLKYPCVKDNGLYVCTVYSGEETKLKKMVTLSVRDHGEPTQLRENLDPDRPSIRKTRQTPEDSSPENIPLNLESSIN